MKSLEKEKLCIHCEGRIPVEATRCHLCSAEQSGKRMQNSFHAPIFQQQSLEDSLTSLYTPPYQGKQPQFGQEEREEPSFYPEEQETSISNTPIQEDPFLQSNLEEAPVEKSTLWPTIYLTCGANLALMGLLQLFFSKNGKLTLEWNAHYWFFYCLLGAPLLYFGYKKLKEI